MLDILFSLDRGHRGVMTFVVDKELHAVSFCESFDETFSVLVHAASEITRNADVNRTVWLARKNVDPISIHCGNAVWIAGSSPAMTWLELTDSYCVAGSALSSHAAMTAAISLLFFSSISTWLLPLIPRSASRMKLGFTPACRRNFTVQWS